MMEKPPSVPAVATDSELGKAVPSREELQLQLTQLRGERDALQQRLARLEAEIAVWRSRVADIRNSAIEPAIGNAIEQCADRVAALLHDPPIKKATSVDAVDPHDGRVTE
jgi:chromosome segregation ATPase